jgi:hypothetical protein
MFFTALFQNSGINAKLKSASGQGGPNHKQNNCSQIYPNAMGVTVFSDLFYEFLLLSKIRFWDRVGKATISLNYVEGEILIAFKARIKYSILRF